MENGWVKLHRKFKENSSYKKSQYVHLWVHLLLSANSEKKKFNWNGSEITVNEGQMIVGRKKLAEDTGIPETTIERILATLESGHQIGQQKTNKYRLISILNWKSYQERTTNRTTSGQQADTNKKYKKDKNNTIAEPSSAEIPLLIKSFESINPACKKLYGNTTQRKACQDLINTYTFERVKAVIEKTLPKTNGLEFFPTISTPLKLYEKWSELESAIRRYAGKVKTAEEKSGVALW